MALPPQDPAPDPAAALLAAAAVNPELERLLAERDLLMRRMEEIAQRSPGAFAGHDTVRFPVEPLGERQRRDSRWAQTRDENRSAAIQRILESRRRDAAASLDQWPQARERQRVEAASDARAERQEAEAQARALDERIERARRDLLAERWAGRAPGPGDDWHALREQQAADALAGARARTAEAAAREQALERRIARDRATRPHDWSEQRERRRAEALAFARRQALEAAAAEQVLDQRLARAREDRLRQDRAAHDPERAPIWVPPSERPDGDPPPEPSRRLPRTAAERSLDERIARVREPAPRAAPAARGDQPAERVRREPEPRREARRRADPPERTPPRPDEPLRSVAHREKDDPDERRAARREASVRAVPGPAEPPVRARAEPARPAARAPAPAARLDRSGPERRREAAPPAERPRGSAESFEQRQDRLRETRAEARRRQARARRIGEPAVRQVERAAGTVRRLDASLDRIGRELREIGADDATLRRIDRGRGATAGLSSGAERVRRATGGGRDALRAWEERRDRILRAARKPDDLGFRAASERRLGMAIGSVDELTALRDKARELWPEKKKEEEKEPDRPRTAADRLQDLDKRREQAVERLKARRRGEQRDERRRALSLDRLASMGDRFSGLGG